MAATGINQDYARLMTSNNTQENAAPAGSSLAEISSVESEEAAPPSEVQPRSGNGIPNVPHHHWQHRRRAGRLPERCNGAF